MWWLALCMILMCIIERKKLEDVALAFWFNMFSLSKWTTIYSDGFLTSFV